VRNLFVRFNGSSGIGNLNWFQLTGAVPPLPAPWLTADIGTVGLAGGATTTNGTFTLNGSGADIWNATDAFHFVNQPVNGNCEIRARVASLLNTDPWAKAGIMIRDGMAAGAANVAVVLTPSNGVSFQVRPHTSNATTATIVGTLTTPRWLRLARTAGNSFAAYHSSDGTNWTQIGSNTPVSIASNAFIGLAVSAHNNASNCVATFENVSVNQSPVLAAISDQTVLAGTTLTITNQIGDADIPAQTLAYSLFNAPIGSSINTNTGLFAWRPAILQSPSTQTVSVIVTDNGVPGMAATQTFSVTVNRPASPSFYNATATNGKFGTWISGDAGPDYVIQTSSDLLSWTTVSTSTPPVTPFWWMDTNSPQTPSQFYRVILGP
jgi:hypothetical protein